MKRSSILFCLALLPMAAGEAGSQEERFRGRDVKSIALEGLTERFRLCVEEGRGDVVVRREGERGDLEGVAVHLTGRKLRLRGKRGEQPAVTIVAPPGLDVRVRNCHGGEIGDTHARLDLRGAGSGGYQVGEVRGAEDRKAGGA